MNPDEEKNVIEKIKNLKEEHGAVILAHNYQIPEVQEIADHIGDSLELARISAEINCEMIVFCGVDFMAETAAILSPEKKVVLPVADARCPMADMVTAGEVRVLRERLPDAAVVCYVNTSAEVKAESDICCTSANAVAVVESADADRIIFVPDRNLGRYVSRFTQKEIIPWEGYCIVHDRITPADVTRARHLHPGAEVLVHPECRPGVIDLADFIYSTSGMVRHACKSPSQEFIIGTETGLLYQLEKKCPDKKFYPLSEDAVCINMKKTTIDHVIRALENEGPVVSVPDDIAARAKTAIKKMLELRI